MFNNDRDGNMRFSRTIVRYKGEPYWCKRVDGDLQFILFPLTGTERVLVDRDDKDLDVTPVPLGLVCYGRTLVYLSRTPARRWKQGLNRESLRGTAVGGRAKPVGEEMMRSQTMKRLIEGSFPSLKEAVKEAKKTGRSTFSREFGIVLIRDNLVLVHKTRYVGTVQEGEPVLHARFKYLTERLQEALNG